MAGGAEGPAVSIYGTRHGALPDAVARPHRAVRALGADEEQAAAEDGEPLRVTMAGSGAEVAHHPLVPRPAVALPQLAPGDAVIGAEEDAAPVDRQRTRLRIAPSRGQMSVTRHVPSGVPSVRQSSSP